MSGVMIFLRYKDRTVPPQKINTQRNMIQPKAEVMPQEIMLNSG